jgi:hypothetical protein
MNLKGLLEELDIPFATEQSHPNVRHGWYGVDCPFCESESGKYYLGINIERLYANCWRCGPHWLPEALAGIPIGKAAALLKPMYGVYKELEVKTRGKYRPPKAVDLCPIHLDYLKNRRGFARIAELQKLWEIQGTTNASKYSWRILIPVRFRGQLVSWTTRAIDDEIVPRYRAAPPERESVPIREVLYGYDYCRHVAIIHEGPIDVWKVGPGAVCSFGVGYTYQQLNLLRKIPTRYVCFDAETAAQRRAETLCSQLATFPGETYNITLDSNDPGQATRKELRQLRKLLK